MSLASTARANAGGAASTGRTGELGPNSALRAASGAGGGDTSRSATTRAISARTSSIALSSAGERARLPCRPLLAGSRRLPGRPKPASSRKVALQTAVVSLTRIAVQVERSDGGR